MEGQVDDMGRIVVKLLRLRLPNLQELNLGGADAEGERVGKVVRTGATRNLGDTLEEPLAFLCTPKTRPVNFSHTSRSKHSRARRRVLHTLRASDMRRTLGLTLILYLMTVSSVRISTRVRVYGPVHQHEYRIRKNTEVG